MKKVIVLALAFSLIGLGVVQYRFLIIGLRGTYARFSYQARNALQAAKQELHGENEMSLLLASIVAPGPGNLDSLRGASERLFRGFLKDKLLSQGLDIDFAFAITDGLEIHPFLQSEGFNDFDSISHYRIFLEGLLPQRCGCRLVLHLKAQNLVKYLISQLNHLTIPFLIFFFLIGGCFIWLVRFLEEQRKLDEVKNDFINNLTHELKTPVFTIGLTTSMLQKTVKSDPERQYLEVIRRENEALKLQVNKVLELASLEKSRQVLEKEHLDIHEALAPTIEFFRIHVDQQGGSFRYFPEAAMARAWIDPVHLGNALHNLLENALKYSGEEKIIEVRTFNQKSNCCISVRDWGVGVAPSDRKKVFEKFYRVNSGDIHQTKGFGLGLSYVRQVARLHGGAVKVESPAPGAGGKGSLFTLCIPVN
ncbi:MAG: HAMP domain-containing histidine kinase [Phaeodactylibacter sp.]|nr:HAMP domain-containing histidine kinase [Phaeodactylibacter sp.]